MSTKPVKILGDSIDELFDKVIKRKASEPESKELTEEEFKELDSLIGHNVLAKALDILDKNRVTLFSTSNGLRQLLEFVGSNREIYKIFPNLNYCCCYSFRFQVLKNQAKYCCKHVLAGKIALGLDLLTPELISEQNFQYLLKQITIKH